MIEERIILQVLAEQRDEILGYDPSKWVSRREESLFEFDSTMAQVVIGIRRSGKSTICHKVLLEHGIRYGYVNLDDDRLLGMEAKDLNTVLSCIYQLYGTNVPYLFLDEIQDVDGWHLFVNRLLRSKMRIFVTGSNAKLLSSELATHLTGRYNEILEKRGSQGALCGMDAEFIKKVFEAIHEESVRQQMEIINK